MELGVIIVSWNVCHLLDHCLKSLKTEIERSQLETHVWVVDNASTDDSATMVHTQHPWVTLEEPGENLGFVRGNNLILRHFLQGDMPELVWLLNPDTKVHTGAISILKQLFDQHPRAGLVGPKLINPDGSLQHGAFRFPGLLQPLFDVGRLPRQYYNTGLNGRYAEHKYNNTQPFPIDHPLGAAMMARGEAITEVGPLDEQFFMYCEEIDWAWRMKKAGWVSWLAPEALVTHYGGASTGQAKPQATAYLWESRARLYRKHRSPIIQKITGRLVNRTFTKLAQDATPEWRNTYQRIADAWN